MFLSTSPDVFADVALLRAATETASGESSAMKAILLAFLVCVFSALHVGCADSHGSNPIHNSPTSLQSQSTTQPYRELGSADPEGPQAAR